MNRTSVFASATVLAATLACGGSAPPAEAPTAPVAEATAAPESQREATPTEPAAAPVAEAPAAKAEPAAEKASAPAAAPADDPNYRFETKSTSGRPMARYEVEKEIETTIGGSGGVFKVAGATLFIPEGSLRQGVNVLFGVDPKAKGPAGALGAVYKIGPQSTSSGSPFQLALPMPASAKTAHFAIELTSVDAKGKVKTTWKIVPASHISASQHLAVLDVETLPEGHVALTSQAK